MLTSAVFPLQSGPPYELALAPITLFVGRHSDGKHDCLQSLYSTPGRIVIDVPRGDSCDSLLLYLSQEHQLVLFPDLGFRLYWRDFETFWSAVLAAGRDYGQPPTRAGTGGVAG